MQQYKVLNDIIKGAKPGQTVNLTDDEARAYGSDYVELIGDLPQVEDQEEKEENKKNSDEKETADESQKKATESEKEENKENSDEDSATKGVDNPPKDKAITNAKNKGL